ncbi:MAG: 23S rRNA (pseudouridine(1915)-N(3))-methyltransferase RlmH [Magnetococcales bacterium]|nr:23S rRNA (pseudouridine(1915)-N(3))-methyltransferase RlmH [Magnetococcales bacterium]
MRFSVIAVGRGAPRPVKALVEDYSQRLQRMAPVTLIEVAEERRTPANSGNIEQLLLKEAARIQNKIPNGALVVPLDISGQVFSSVDFSAKIRRTQELGDAEICFLIGGPDGLHPTLLNEPWRLSFGPMTYPHMLVRVVLLEQLYRAMTIIERVPYHR